MNPETRLVQAIRLELGSIPDLVLWRNAAGVAEHFDESGGEAVLRKQRFGLAPGAADLIGCLSGRFIGLEVKMPKTGRVSDDQRTWLALVRLKGGFAAVVRSVEEAQAAIQRARQGACE